jgi:hypothetical protein
MLAEITGVRRRREFAFPANLTGRGKIDERSTTYPLRGCPDERNDVRDDEKRVVSLLDIAE